MRQFIAWSACLAASICSVCSMVVAEEPPPVRLDLYSDPLPRGAISRLGARTPGLPPSGAVPAIKFTCDDFMGFSPDGKQFTSGRQLWDVATGHVAHELKLGGRVVFAPYGDPYAVTFHDNRLTARPLKPVPPGWEVPTLAPALSPATGLVLFQLKPGDDDPARGYSTNLRNVFSGLDAHRIEGELLAGAGEAPDPWRIGVSQDGGHFSFIKRSGQMELLKRGEAAKRTATEDLPGFSPNNPSTTVVSRDGKHLAIFPNGRGGRIQVLTANDLKPISALRDATPADYGGGRFGAALLGDATQLAVLRGGGATTAPTVLKVWNGTTEGLRYKRNIRSSNDLRDVALWLAARGLRGEVPDGFIPLDRSPHYSTALQCQLSSALLVSTAAISRSGELVALADDICISIWETATHQCVQRMQPGDYVVRLVFSPDDRLLLAHYERNTALVFEAVQPADDLRTRSTKDLWNDLAGKRARPARKAMLELARRGDEVLPLLDEVFARGPTAEEIHRWIADLDAADQAEREAAQARLHALGMAGLPYLQAAVRGSPSDEQIVRIRAILEHPAETVVDADVLRAIRAIQVAGMIGSEPALARLKRFAEGKFDARLVSRAEETLRRLRPAPGRFVP